ncbi:FliI/YscN family ATPase [Salmonella enterica subsp. enterica serovar Bredeney]|nr:FliI/YscN family ATPase [Salmonella enterica subsp. enterica serovar Bredeney]ECD3237268.1 FliI/YscN family ATPase [Salmonella enterica subsp. enterica serovar Bredeney]EDO5628538.1 FliI/YscN family ATPase [Salmonella enterica]HCM6292662.1 type III secretion system ATPase SctN [Salmonella enterica subsp. enterica serovar 16:l,v:-]
MTDRPFIRVAHPLRIQGGIIEAYLPDVHIGEICKIERSLTNKDVLGEAQVIGFSGQNTQLSLLTENHGLSRNVLIVPTGHPFKISVNDDIVGAIIDSHGDICGRLSNHSHKEKTQNAKKIAINSLPRDFSQRCPVTDVFKTGVRAIDTLLTCGKGQRIGIFAAAGCGKTSLMRMLIEYAEADVIVIGVVGERSREVTELVVDLKKSNCCHKIILVYTTSDRSCIERYNAAQIATTIAEYFSDKGNDVLLFMDSITRYARALRDIALSLGELPARKGYPASVFEDLPKLLERPGHFQYGSITAFYTVLIENEDESDVIGDEVRSVLDGHIYLSQKLAFRGYYPAIDILKSISRVFYNVTTERHQVAASKFREILTRQADMQMAIELGEYRRGENAENDMAYDKKKIMENFLKQAMNDNTEMSKSLNSLYEIIE